MDFFLLAALACRQHSLVGADQPFNRPRRPRTSLQRHLQEPTLFADHWFAALTRSIAVCSPRSSSAAPASASPALPSRSGAQCHADACGRNKSSCIKHQHLTKVLHLGNSGCLPTESSCCLQALPHCLSAAYMPTPWLLAVSHAVMLMRLWP
jgi:hypothetical protein